METNRNPIGLIIGAIICIVIGTGSFQIAYETYEEIKKVKDKEYYYNKIRYSKDQIAYFSRDLGISSDDYIKKYFFDIKEYDSILQAEQISILYASSFIFSISLCCFTYLCVKK